MTDADRAQLVQEARTYLQLEAATESETLALAGAKDMILRSSAGLDPDATWIVTRAFAHLANLQSDQLALSALNEAIEGRLGEIHGMPYPTEDG